MDLVSELIVVTPQCLSSVSGVNGCLVPMDLRFCVSVKKCDETSKAEEVKTDEERERERVERIAKNYRVNKLFFRLNSIFHQASHNLGRTRFYLSDPLDENLALVEA